MVLSRVKTIDIQTLKWFDKVNGNTYFASTITLNFGKKDSETIVQPFQYGYSSYTYKALEFLKKHFNKSKDFDIQEYVRKKDIIIRQSERYTLKRELMNL